MMISTALNDAISIVKELQRHGYQAVFVGGFVRDKIMQNESNDIDIATSALPDNVEMIFEKTVPAGKSFGVIRVLLNDYEFEVATFRIDGRYLDGRRPETVTFSSMQDDAKRRDFTINGLFYDPIADKFIDYVDGRKDIRDKVIRFIGDPQVRIDEDKLRILRGIRFAVKFDFTIESNTYEAIKFNASNIVVISQERIRDELVKLFRIGKPRIALNYLFDTGLINYILPEVERMKGVQQPTQFHPEGDVLEHIIRTMENLFTMNPSDELIFAALLHDVGKPATNECTDRIRFPEHAKVGADIARDVLSRLMFSNDFIDHTCDLIYQHMTPMSIKEMRKSTLRKFLGQDHIDDILALLKADSLGGNGDLTEWDFAIAKKNEYLKEEIKPLSFINGRDLIDIGFVQSPLIGKILREIYDRQLEGEITNKDAAIEAAKALVGKR